VTERWLELTVRVAPPEVDDVCAVLHRWASARVAVELLPNVHAGGPACMVRAYLPDGIDAPATRDEVVRALWHLGASGSPSLRAPEERWLEPSDYLDAWKAFYQPLPIGERFLIVPTWLPAPQTERTVIRMDPGMAFGTGLHATTRDVVHALEAHVRPGDRVIDVGTGSGILAMVAARLGAAEVRAVDTDPDAVRTARANAAANGLGPTVRTDLGEARPVVGWCADVLVANIVAAVHVAHAQAYAALVCAGGTAILGGILRSREQEVVASMQGAGFAVRAVEDDGEWACVTGRRVALDGEWPVVWAPARTGLQRDG